MNEILRRLSEVVTEIHYVWSLYREVYAGSAEQTALLNRNGSNFFYFNQQLTIDYIALMFAKLTDPNKQGRFENLSLKQLHSYANESGDNEFARELRSKFQELEAACEVFRVRRNKTIAHADLSHALNVNEEPLPGVSPDYIENALSKLRSYMTLAEEYFLESVTVYEATTGPMSAGGTALIAALERGDFGNV
ncbi:AbiU2 domain-containing protein [Marinobacter sp. C2H3]|uniref:AbiU2 domain-containing protein n=1 Tax=Marinobacter sp. C2H3 TaxID=3119003 RepID=UPI00300EAE16